MLDDSRHRGRPIPSLRLWWHSLYIHEFHSYEPCRQQCLDLGSVSTTRVGHDGNMVLTRLWPSCYRQLTVVQQCVREANSTMERRSLLIGLASLFVASPAIVCASSIMPVKAWKLQPIVKRMWVTPEMAKEWLATTALNRRPVQHVVDRYAQKMRAGQWFDETGDCIWRSPNGRLLDGQHRLAACVAANVPMATLVGVSDRLGAALDMPLICGKR